MTAAIASFIGGTVANILFTAFAAPLAGVALDFSDPETFALMLLAFSTFIGLGGDDLAKTFFCIAFGFVLATVGVDPVAARASRGCSSSGSRVSSRRSISS